MDIIPIVAKYIALIPAASPSRPSIKFIQLIHPNMKNIVIMYDRIPKSK